ncbi:MAG: thiamine pyrophosphate-binding protein [Chthoniobacterales bacterium]
MKVSDYVIDFLVKRGVGDIFMVTGGGIMHLVDSVGRHAGMRYICNNHEQACAIAAEAYARTRRGVGACLVTTGPGSTNALSGIAGAFVDSVPVIVISGQVRRDIIADYAKLRQLGPQEINIEPMARPVVKYFKTLMDPAMLRYELECAWQHATSGRPGPVWINIPLDVQGADFDETSAPAYEEPGAEHSLVKSELQSKVKEVIEMLQQAKRPVLIGGNGVHLGGAHEAFVRFVEKIGAPVLSTTGGMDLLDESHPLYMGRFGPTGQRRANFTLQNSDLMITVGASMSIGSIGFNTAGFAPKAKRIMVSVDPNEMEKPNFKPDLNVAADAGRFFEEFLAQANGTSFEFSSAWRDACTNWKQRYPTITPDYYADKEHVNSYVFARALSDALDTKDVVVTGNSLDIVSIIQSFVIRLGQRVFTNINYGSMGWDLPGAVGACVGAGRQRTCLMTGDGSVQFNIQEMMTVRANNLPVKIFVLNNAGYESIRATQRNFFNSHFVGSDFKTGIGNPDWEKLAAAYRFGYERIANNDEIAAKLPNVLNNPEPFLCELNLSPDQPRSPKTMSVRREDGSFETRPLEDMFPFLPREEVWENMHLFDEPSPARAN